jgi:hypothetical protein
MGYKLSWEPHGVVIRFSGSMTIDDIVNASVEYEADGRFDGLQYVIADYTQITGCTTKPEQIDDVWAIDTGAKISNKNIRKAIVTTSPDVVAMADRYKGAPYCAFPVKCFTTESDARAWLNAR